MFASTIGGGQAMGFPDVCLTPAPPSPSPIPIPYPNTAMLPQGNPGTAVSKVLIAGAPAANMSTQIMMTNGDNAGVATGVASGMVMGPAKAMLGVMKIMMGGQPAIHLTTQFGHNGASPNCPAGVQVAPSQTKVILMG
jgi:hypothetical protein